MKTVLKIAASLAAAAAFGAGHAQAATWLLDYTATNGGAPSEATLTLKTSDILNAVGGYDITSVAGDVDGDVVTGGGQRRKRRHRELRRAGIGNTHVLPAPAQIAGTRALGDRSLLWRRSFSSLARMRVRFRSDR